MFDDDFEAMLEAVCEVAGSETPKLPKPKPRPKTPRPKPEHRPSNSTGISRQEKSDDPYNVEDYVPPQGPPKLGPTYDRSRQIFNTMKSSVTKERISPGQAEAYARTITNIVAEHGNIYIDNQQFPGMGKLYPREAVEAILLAQTRYWPTGYKLDDVLESIMYGFVKKHPDPQEFVRDLADAIHESDSMAGVLLRLNLNTVVKPSVDSITIRTKFGTVTQSKIPRRSAFTGELREKMKFWLQQQGAFTPHIEVIYRGLERVDKEYSTERRLISWMGYLVTRTMAENAKQTKLKKGGGGQLLLEEGKSVAAGTP